MMPPTVQEAATQAQAQAAAAQAASTEPAAAAQPAAAAARATPENIAADAATKPTPAKANTLKKRPGRPISIPNIRKKADKYIKEAVALSTTDSSKAGLEYLRESNIN